jgi:hypothetical protein
MRQKRGTIKQAPDGRLYTDESTLQSVCVKGFRLRYRQYEDFLFSIPNGARIGGRIGKKGFPILASILKAEGMTEGIPDLLLAFPTGGFAGLFIEMKTIVGSLEPEQRRKCEKLASVGYAVAKCETADEFDRTVDAYLSGRFVLVEFWKYKRPRKIVS